MGLSAALYLGRARRRRLLCDAGEFRDAASPHIHGFVSQDGIASVEFLRTSREQLAPYDTVEVRRTGVADAGREDSGFMVELEDGTQAFSRKLLLATGMEDLLPGVRGMEKMWGKGP